jgi:aryl-alcohol dehydrogenase-like predicted oxidoreductase
MDENTERMARVRWPSGLETSRLGLGAMVLTRSYAEPDAEESRAALALALDLGVTLVDTADSYASGANEEFLGRWLGSARDDVVLTSKFGLVPGPDGVTVDGRPEHVRRACDASLARLGVEHLDLYYQHRVDPLVPVAETVGAMAELVAAGKVRALGLCEVDGAQLRAADAVHPVAAVQSEWSLWARRIEADVLAVARELGAAVVPYAPLGRGFLAGAIDRRPADGDLRAADPRLSGDNLDRNLRGLAVLRGVADELGATPAQVALAWLLAQGEDVVPIPGVERRDLLRENVRAVGLRLDADRLAALDAAFPPEGAAGDPDATLLRTPGAGRRSA